MNRYLPLNAHKYVLKHQLNCFLKTFWPKFFGSQWSMGKAFILLKVRSSKVCFCSTNTLTRLKHAVALLSYTLWKARSQNGPCFLFQSNSKISIMIYYTQFLPLQYCCKIRKLLAFVFKSTYNGFLDLVKCEYNSKFNHLITLQRFNYIIQPMKGLWCTLRFIWIVLLTLETISS